MAAESTCFPPGFLWGAATSAYQIEGSPLADGAGVSNWHRFAHTPGRIVGDANGDVACDHYRRWPEDVALMRALGLKAYRFSIAWSRVLPDGRRLNVKGIDFYRRLVDALEAAGIEACVTLHHWDLPAALDDLGGWAERDTAERFADYAQTLYRALAGQVRWWATLNEPWVMVEEGYLRGTHPPGVRSLAKAGLAAHNLLRGHALAVQAGRAERAGRVGLVVNLEPQFAVDDSAEQRAALARAHAWINRRFLDPVFLGNHPEEVVAIHGEDWPQFPAADLELIREPIDWLGINYYSRAVVRADPAALPVRVQRVRQDGAEHTAMDWEVYPDGLRAALLWVRRRYGELPLFVTENGAAFDDPEPARGRVADSRRVAYFREHLRAARAAIAAGVPLQGYFAWSLLDNFEWAFGYGKRFGLVHVDFATQQRTLKDSAHFYREVIASHGGVLDRE